MNVNPETESTTPALELSGVEAGYGGRTVLRGVDLRVDAGSIFGVLGPNGSGKTTLLKVICGVLRPNRGEVRVHGQPLGAMSRRDTARSLAVVPQVTHVEFNFSAYDITAMGRTPYQKPLAFENRDDPRIIRESMEATDTWDLRERNFRELSGGESQRVIIARCLAQRCRLLLLDEPTSHLDIKYQAEIFRLLLRLRNERGITIVINTHDLNLAALFCDHVMLLRDGRNVAVGAPRDVITAGNVREVFDAPVRVAANPDTGIPFVTPDL